MTYLELLNKLKDLSEEQLSCEAVYVDTNSGEKLSVVGIYDDDGHIVMDIEQ